MGAEDREEIYVLKAKEALSKFYPEIDYTFKISGEREKDTSETREYFRKIDYMHHINSLDYKSHNSCEGCEGCSACDSCGGCEGCGSCGSCAG